MNTHRRAITFGGKKYQKFKEKQGGGYVKIWRAEGKDRNVEIKIQSQKKVFNCKVLRKIIFSLSFCFERTYLDFSHIQGKNTGL